METASIPVFGVRGFTQVGIKYKNQKKEKPVTGFSFIKWIFEPTVSYRVDRMDLFKAINSGDVQRVRDSIDRGADVNDVDSQGTSILSTACYYGYTEIVQMLIEAGADVNYINTDWTTPLLLATQEGEADIVEMLLKEGASLTAGTTADGLTALDLAEELLIYSRKETDYRRILGMLRDALW